MIQAPNAREDSNINATENAIAAVTKILQFNNSQVSIKAFNHFTGDDKLAYNFFFSNFYAG